MSLYYSKHQQCLAYTDLNDNVTVYCGDKVIEGFGTAHRHFYSYTILAAHRYRCISRNTRGSLSWTPVPFINLEQS
ncbi:hypothetical protein CC80DRAFT_490768 [Byssothecium circinans]|uniref:Uncharacterized protein n=1 Tax=Byssothecium circinans TaxID=147558 RepID=A0A6A5T6W9_9PLEO|nr:hypothetical protein CC80DRAFT_498295 [Byssothecium circinans]KAF1959027.1 hypothetical protein CC80DRAFT_490768 [Byssothecium circinans]